MIEEIIDKTPVSLDMPISEVEEKLLQETNVDTLKDIINIFNLNIQKKNIVRIGKLTEIQDLITDQIEERVKQRPGEFNNQDLLSYFKTVQETISKSDNTLDKIDTPAIQINQNQLNINVTKKEDDLDKESRDRVMDAVKAILDKASKESENAIEVNYLEVKEEINND